MILKSLLLNRKNMYYHNEFEGSSKKASLYITILGCLKDANILTSFNAFSFSLSDSVNSLTFFKAYS